MKLKVNEQRIAELRELQESSSPGEWVSASMRISDWTELSLDDMLTRGTREFLHFIMVEGDYHSWVAIVGNGTNSPANADYIVAVQMAVPDLLDDMETLKERVRELETAARIVHDRYHTAYSKYDEWHCCPNAMRELHDVLKETKDDNSLRSSQHKSTSGVPD